MTACRGSRPTREHRQRPRERGGPLPGPAERERRAPRRRARVRQRRQAYFTTGEHFDPAASQDLTSPAGRSTASTRTARPHRQPVLRRRRAERGLDLGPRAAQPVPLLLRRPDRRCSSATSAATIPPPPRRRSTSARRAPTTAGRQRGGLLPPVHEPDLHLRPQRARRRDHGRVRLPRHAVPGATRAAYFFADYTQNWIRRMTFDATAT